MLRVIFCNKLLIFILRIANSSSFLRGSREIGFESTMFTLLVSLEFSSKFYPLRIIFNDDTSLEVFDERPPRKPLFK